MKAHGPAELFLTALPQIASNPGSGPAGDQNSMTETILSAQTRSTKGKGAMRKLRRAGKIPGVVYGLETPVSVQVDAHEAAMLVKALHGSERLISLQVENGGADKAKAVLLKEVQTTPVGGNILHIDFLEVDVSQTVQVAVEVHPEGRSQGETMGGILQQVTREITIECLPTNIPESIPADVTALEIGHSLHLSDIPLPEGIQAITPLEETLFVVAAPRVEEAAEEEGVEGEEGELEAGEEAEGEAGEEQEGEDS